MGKEWLEAGFYVVEWSASEVREVHWYGKRPGHAIAGPFCHEEVADRLLNLQQPRWPFIPWGCVNHALAPDEPTPPLCLGCFRCAHVLDVERVGTMETEP